MSSRGWDLTTAVAAASVNPVDNEHLAVNLYAAGSAAAAAAANDDDDDDDDDDNDTCRAGPAMQPYGNRIPSSA
jgi:hypothetical protein